MPGNKYNCNPLTPRSRLERLLRERELRRSNLASQTNEDGNRHAELSSFFLTDGENSALSGDEDSADGAAAARAFVDGCEWQEGRPSKQRLLVVANRLPVSAVRKGEDSWQLEISVGGLVSALLGKDNSSFLIPLFSVHPVFLVSGPFFVHMIRCMFYSFGIR